MKVSVVKMGIKSVQETSSRWLLVSPLPAHHPPRQHSLTTPSLATPPSQTPACLLTESHLLLQHAHAYVGSLIVWAQCQRLLVVRLREGQVAQLEEAI